MRTLLCAGWLCTGGLLCAAQDSVTLDFPAVAARKAGMVNDLTGLNVTSMSFADTAYSVGGNAINMASARMATAPARTTGNAKNFLNMEVSFCFNT